MLGFWLRTPPALGAEQLPLACPEQAVAATATNKNVVLVQLGEELSCAVTAALDPWGLRVVSSPALKPAPSVPSMSRVAQDLARRHQAQVVVWLTSDSDGAALWIYDAARNKTVARSVPDAPLNATSAAALALSIKTVVRMVGLAPEPTVPPPPSRSSNGLRTDSQLAPVPAQPSETPGEPETPIEPSETPAEAGETPTKPGETPTEPGEPEPEPASAKSPESASADPLRAWYLGVFGGARLGPFSEVSPRFAIEGRWMPAQVWLGLAFESGSPYTVRESDFEGRFIDVGSELALGWTQRLGRFMAAGVSGSLAVYVSHLSGTVLPDEDSVSVVRVNPVFYARAEVQLKQGRFTLYLQPAIGLWLQRQNYLVRGLSLVHTERLTGRIVLGLQVAVD